MITTRTADVALILAWSAGAVLAFGATLSVGYPGWPFPGAPLVIALGSTLAWHVRRTGPRPPSLAVAGLCAAVSALLVGIAVVAWASGRVPASFAMGVSAVAALFGATFAYAGRRGGDA